jgi:hypothetical protein
MAAHGFKGTELASVGGAIAATSSPHVSSQQVCLATRAG